MLIVIQYRNFGIDQLFSTEDAFKSAVEAKHLGLNMTEELVFLNRYQANLSLPVEWGYNYFTNAVNFIPRALWENKPNPGHRFAELRVGFHRGELAATISNGVIGQGVANFGKWLGPIAPAVLLLFLCSWICNFIKRRRTFLRACVVLVCLSTIPNLGRDITLLTLWPLIFGTIAVITFERQWKPDSHAARSGVDSDSLRRE